MIGLLGLICLALIIIHQFWYRRRSLPNGPMPWPLIGNYMSLVRTKRWEDKFLEWKDKYGPVYTLWMGLRPAIMVSDYDTAVRLFVNQSDVYSDRPRTEKFDKLVRGESIGVIGSSGTRWQELRRMSLKILRDFGLGKNKMETRVLDEVQTICDGINSEINAGIVEHDVNKFTDIAVGSVINSLICGYRFSANGKQREFYHLKSLLNEAMKYFNDPIADIGIHNERLFNFPIIRQRIERSAQPIRKLMAFMDTIIDEHKRQVDYSSLSDDFVPNDYIDAYMMEKRKAESTGGSHVFSGAELRNVTIDLWFAGQETTSSTIQWGIAYLIRHPEVQRKLHDEFDRVIGDDRLIRIADRSSLPYMNAVIMEIQRCTNLLTINLPHVTAIDTQLNGCTIKRGTLVFPQISVIMADPKNFHEPKAFNPSRFIDEHGRLVNNEKVMPFSLGKRICLGEGLARMELFLILGNLFNQYKFFSASEAPTLERLVAGGTPICTPYRCCLVKRFQE